MIHCIITCIRRLRSIYLSTYLFHFPDVENRGEEDIEQRSTNKRKAVETIDDLHREVLILQREKLRLKIELLRSQVKQKVDASTQTIASQEYSYLRALYDENTPL